MGILICYTNYSSQSQYLKLSYMFFLIKSITEFRGSVENENSVYSSDGNVFSHLLIYLLTYLHDLIL